MFFRTNATSSKLVFALMLMCASTQILAAGPGDGNLTKNNVRIGNCIADSLTVKWRLGSLMGEPTVSGSYEWRGKNGCELPTSTTVWLEVVSGSMKGYVDLRPVTPKANGGYGYNTTGSPNWRSTLCEFNGPKPKNCYDESSAKQLWKTGKVIDFAVAW